MSLRNRQDYDASFKVLNKESSEDESTGDYHSLTPTKTTQVGQQSEVCTQSRHFLLAGHVVFLFCFLPDGYGVYKCALGVTCLFSDAS